MAGPDLSSFGVPVAAPPPPAAAAPRKGAAPDLSAFGTPVAQPSPRALQVGQQLVKATNSSDGNPVLEALGVGAGLLRDFAPGLADKLPNEDSVRQAVSGFTSDLSDMATAGLAAAAAAAHNIAAPKDQVSPADFYNGARAAQLARTAQYGTNANRMINAVGAVTGALALGAGAKAAGFAAKGAPLIPRLAAAIPAGAGIGAITGAASAPTAQDIPRAALGGAKVGALVAPAGVLGVEAVKGAAGTPFMQGVGRGLGAAGHAVGEGVKNAFVPAPTSSTPEAIAAAEPQALQQIQEMMDRLGVSREDLANAANTGRGLTAAEAIGPEAESQVSALSRRPGQTAGAAQEQLTGRSADALGRFGGDVHSATNISPDEARNAVDAIVHKGQAEVKPLFEAALGSPQPVMGGDLPRMLAQTPVKRAMDNVQNWMKLAGLDAEAPTVAVDPDTGMKVTGDDLKSVITMAPTPTAWDLVRRELNQLVERDQTGAPILDGERGGMNRLRMAAADRLTQNLREQIPGYADALDKSAQYLKVRDAYNRSGAMLNQGTPSQTVADWFGTLSDPEKQAVKMSFARQLYDMIDKGTMRPSIFLGYGQGTRENIANKLAAVFRPDVAQKLVDAARVEEQLQNSAYRMVPNRGSITSNALLGDDPYSPAGQNIGKQLAEGNVKGAGITALFGPAGRAAQAPGEIAIRDAKGQLLLLSPPRLADRLSRLPQRPGALLSIDPAAAAAASRTGLLARPQDQQ